MLQDRSVTLVSDITVFNKYAKFIKEFGRRENWPEICLRNSDMHVEKFPSLAEIIERTYDQHVVTKQVLPSMRSMQFGGRPIVLNEARIYNCAYMPAESAKFFSELMFLLLGGTGVGYSVQKRHVGQLPKVKAPESDLEYKFQVQDSIIGWADAIKVVAKAFFNAGTLPIFDYRDIREKGTELVTSGGKAPGPEPLKNCIERIIPVFRQAVGRKLRPVEVHDIACTIADAVLAGGIRRAAMICLFDRNDLEMIGCKAGARCHITHIPGSKNTDGTVSITFEDQYGRPGKANVTPESLVTWSATGMLPWYYVQGSRARANNSAVLLRGHVSQEEFDGLIDLIKQSGCGEPGIYWTNNLDWGTNPCCEIGLKPYQMCNLTTINAGAVVSQEDYNNKAKAAAFIGTLQAAYTDFHYLRPIWKKTCEEDALIGVSMTGIADGKLAELSMTEAAHCVVQTNRDVASAIGINPAARCTCVKPEGTASLVVGTGASGTHAWHAPFYIRRQRANADEALVQYMLKVAPALVEPDVTDPAKYVMSFPQRAPEGATFRSEPMLDLLERVKKISVEWVRPGHVRGENTHNVSCTISVKDDEWDVLGKWMWNNREHYNGIAVLPYHGSMAYPQMPFEEITEEQYLAMLPHLEGIDIGQVFEDSGEHVNLVAEAACAGGQCELSY